MKDSQLADEPVAERPGLSARESIDVLDILLVLGRERRLIAFVTVIALLLGAGVSLLIKPTFTARATILPPEQAQSSTSAILGQIGALAGLGAGGGLLKSPSEMYIGMIMSRTVADRLIDKYHLQSVYKTKDMDDTRKVFKSNVSAETGKDSLIQIAVKDSDPHRASDLANGLIDELYHLTSTLAITEAAQRRVFFTQQLDEEKAALAASEEDLRKTQEKTGLIQLSGQAEEIIQSVASVRAQIVSKEVQLESMRTYATDQNPEVTRLHQEIDSLQQQLTAMENSQRRLQPGDIQVPTGQVPEVGLEYARKLREVTYHSTLLNLLARQDEAARIDEAKSAPLVQVIDHAIPPIKKSGPHRALLTLAAGFLGFFAASLWSFARFGIRRIQEDPESAEKLDELLQVFRGKEKML